MMKRLSVFCVLQEWRPLLPLHLRLPLSSTVVVHAKSIRLLSLCTNEHVSFHHRHNTIVQMNTHSCLGSSSTSRSRSNSYSPIRRSSPFSVLLVLDDHSHCLSYSHCQNNSKCRSKIIKGRTTAHAASRKKTKKLSEKQFEVLWTGSDNGKASSVTNIGFREGSAAARDGDDRRDANHASVSIPLPPKRANYIERTYFHGSKPVTSGSLVIIRSYTSNNKSRNKSKSYGSTDGNKEDDAHGTLASNHDSGPHPHLLLRLHKPVQMHSNSGTKKSRRKKRIEKRESETEEAKTNKGAHTNVSLSTHERDVHQQDTSERTSFKSETSRAQSCDEDNRNLLRWRCVDVSGRTFTLSLPRTAQVILNDKLYSPEDHEELIKAAHAKVNNIMNNKPMKDSETSRQTTESGVEDLLRSLWNDFSQNDNNNETSGNDSPIASFKHTTIERISKCLFSNASDVNVYATYLLLTGTAENHYFSVLSADESGDDSVGKITINSTKTVLASKEEKHGRLETLQQSHHLFLEVYRCLDATMRTHSQNLQNEKERANPLNKDHGLRDFSNFVVSSNEDVNELLQKCIFRMEEIACRADEGRDVEKLFGRNLHFTRFVDVSDDIEIFREQLKTIFESRISNTNDCLGNEDFFSMLLLEYYRRSSKVTHGEMLSLCEAAKDLLLNVGFWSITEPLPFRRAQVDLWRDDDNIINLTESILERKDYKSFDDKDRVDLSYLDTFCIDDPGTVEVDDGVSVERISASSESYRIWIHVADPTRLLSLNDEIDSYAQQRGTSVYLPDRIGTMFPFKLATGPMSLNYTDKVKALSIGVQLGSDGEILHEKTIITTSYIRPQMLTYNAVDTLLHEGLLPQAHDVKNLRDKQLNVLYSLSQLRHAYRSSRGSVDLNFPSHIVKVRSTLNGRPEVSIQEHSQGYGARKLVAEMMIAAGEAMAHVGASNNILMPYRCTQEPHFLESEQSCSENIVTIREKSEMNSPSKLVSLWQQRNKIPRSEFQLSSPSPHRGLGVDQYLQCTSPIRRYNDLISHMQIKAFLRNETPPFESAESLSSLLDATSAAARGLKHLERETNKYWAIRYFNDEQRKQSIWNAIFLGWHKRHEDSHLYSLGVVFLNEIAYESIAFIVDDNLEPGDTLSIRCDVADPISGKLRLTQQ